MYKFWCDYVKPKYGEKAKLCYIEADSFIVYIKTEDIYINIVKHVEARFDTSNFKLVRPLPKGKNKKLISLIKGKLRRKNNIVCSIEIQNMYLTSDNDDNKKAKDTKLCAINQRNLNLKIIKIA